MLSFITRSGDTRADDTRNDQRSGSTQQAEQLIQWRGDGDGDKNRNEHDGQRNGESAAPQTKVKKWSGERAPNKSNWRRNGTNERIVQRPQNALTVCSIGGWQRKLNHGNECQSCDERADESHEQENCEAVCSSMHNVRSRIRIYYWEIPTMFIKRFAY